MSISLESVFGKDKNIVIGAVHLPPTPGYAEAPSIDVAISDATKDTHALVAGGVDSIIFENNYDVPHTEHITEASAEAMRIVGDVIKKETSLPVGVSVLWNDYKTALTLAKELDLAYVRIPVFVDTVKTEYGTFVGNPQEILAYRREIGAEHVALFTDIHVKHATILTETSLAETAHLAIKAGADALIITGKWTGDAPNMTELKTLRKAVGDFPILCGSGVNAQNIRALFEYANGAIVSTSLKAASDSSHAQNVKPYNARIEAEKVRTLVQSI